ncbi:MAG: hypothetical protein P8184_08385 [Calditrichia bacterium]
MKKGEIIQLSDGLKQIQIKIQEFKQKETHLEKNRLLKLIDAEIMDAIHNLNNLGNLLEN